MITGHRHGTAVITFPSPHALTLSEVAGVTTVTVTVLHVSPEARGGHITSGMKTGLQTTLDRLEDVARGLAA